MKPGTGIAVAAVCATIVALAVWAPDILAWIVGSAALVAILFLTGVFG
jgi:hypothetical protein